MLVEAPLYPSVTEHQPQAPTKEARNDSDSPGCAIQKIKGKHMQYKADEKLPFVSIGEVRPGSYGQVDKVRAKLSGDVVFARKRWWKHDERSRSKHLEEIRLLSGLSHWHIVEVVTSYQKGEELGFLMVPFADMDLRTLLRSENPPKQTLKKGLGCLITGLAFLHRKNVLHGDVKPGNILLHNDRFLFTDFGCSKEIHSQEKSATEATIPGTPAYAAPELADHLPRGRSADVFSLGCVLMEIFSVIHDYGSQPETHTSFVGLVPYACHLAGVKQWIQQRIVAHPTPIESMWLDICAKMLRAEPAERPRTTDLHGIISCKYEQGQRDELFCADCIHQTGGACPASVSPSIGTEHVDHEAWDRLRLEPHRIQTDAKAEPAEDDDGENAKGFQTAASTKRTTAQLTRALVDIANDFVWYRKVCNAKAVLAPSQLFPTLSASPTVVHNPNPAASGRALQAAYGASRDRTDGNGRSYAATWADDSSESGSLTQVCAASPVEDEPQSLPHDENISGDFTVPTAQLPSISLNATNRYTPAPTQSQDSSQDHMITASTPPPNCTSSPPPPLPYQPPSSSIATTSPLPPSFPSPFLSSTGIPLTTLPPPPPPPLLPSFPSPFQSPKPPPPPPPSSAPPSVIIGPTPHSTPVDQPIPLPTPYHTPHGLDPGRESNTPFPPPPAPTPLLPNDLRTSDIPEGTMCQLQGQTESNSLMSSRGQLILGLYKIFKSLEEHEKTFHKDLKFAALAKPNTHFLSYVTSGALPLPPPQSNMQLPSRQPYTSDETSVPPQPLPRSEPLQPSSGLPHQYLSSEELAKFSAFIRPPDNMHCWTGLEKGPTPTTSTQLRKMELQLRSIAWVHYGVDLPLGIDATPAVIAKCAAARKIVKQGIVDPMHASLDERAFTRHYFKEIMRQDERAFTRRYFNEIMRNLAEWQILDDGKFRSRL